MRSFIYSRSYQLVSEHSILSAQRNSRVAAIEKILEKKASHNKPEWKEHIDNIKRRLERRRSRCDELLQWLHQFYVTARSRKPEKTTKEPEEDGWNEELSDANAAAVSDFKVYDRGREELEEANSRRRQSREDEFHEKLEEMAEILRSYLSNVAVKSSKSDKERNPELEAVNPETEELERKRLEENKSQGSHDRSRVFVPENRSDEEASLEELTTETPDGDAITAEVCISHNLRKHGLGFTIEGCDAQSGDEEEAQPEEAPQEAMPDESTPEKKDGGATMEAVEEELLACDEAKKLLSRSVEACDVFGRENERSVEWSSRQVDPVALTLGQAQFMVSNTDPLEIGLEIKEVLKEKIKKENKLFGFGGSDISFNSMGQAHNFIVTPPIFTNTGRALQVVDGLNNQREQLFNSSLPLQKSQGVSINIEVEEIITSLGRNNSVFVESEWPKSMVEHLIHMVEFSRRRMRETHHKQWDPGEHYFVSCIIGTSCFKLWDPGGRLLTVCLWYLHLEDKVNV